MPAELSPRPGAPPAEEKVMYDVGAAMTHEQMVAFAGRPAGQMPHEAAASPKPASELLFTDAKVGARRAVLLSMLSPILAQKQVDGKTCVKFKAVTNSLKDAQTVAAGLENEGCNIYAVEMHKFCMLPPIPGVMQPAENVEMMADVLRKHEMHVTESLAAYAKRRQELKEDMKRQQEVQERVRNGELETTSIDSASKYPEPVYDEVSDAVDDDFVDVSDEQPGPARGGAFTLRSDPPACHERYVVFICVGAAEFASALGDERIGPDRILLKVWAAFDDAADADAYGKALKDDLKYKNYDVAVANMFEWLHLPPVVESIEKVVYDDGRLTDIAGELGRNRVNLNHRGLMEPADGDVNEICAVIIFGTRIQTQPIQKTSATRLFKAYVGLKSGEKLNFVGTKDNILLYFFLFD